MNNYTSFSPERQFVEAEQKASQEDEQNRALSSMSENSLPFFENQSFVKACWGMRNGAPWFMARDGEKVLIYASPKEAMRDRSKHEELLKGSHSLSLSGSPRGINIIPESDVYAFILKSNLPQAKDFRQWVCEEVLPSIRKTGKYVLNQQIESNSACFFEKIQPRAMLDAILSHVGLGNEEKAEILDKIREKSFGCSAPAWRMQTFPCIKQRKLILVRLFLIQLY